VTLQELKNEFGTDLKEVKILAGVYFLIRQDTVIYIGRSRNIQERLAVHNLDKTKTLHWWDSVLCIEEHDEKERARLETRLINTHWPELNKQNGGGRRKYK